MIWLPDMDLNHDKQIQSLLCYRYTIGQCKAGVKVSPLGLESSSPSRPLTPRTSHLTLR
jgi:hypothetical protein